MKLKLIVRLSADSLLKPSGCSRTALGIHYETVSKALPYAEMLQIIPWKNALSLIRHFERWQGNGIRREP